MSGTTREGASALHARCRVAIFDLGRSRVLLRQAETGWELLAVETDSAWFETGDVADRLTESLGIDVFVQRCLVGGENESPAADRLYAGCAITDAVSQDGCRWFGLADLPRLTGPTAQACPRLRGWLAGDADARDWERLGWLGEVEDFVTAQLDGPFELRQLRTWSRSSVWRVSGQGSSWIFKASPPIYQDEGGIAAALSCRFPERFPVVLARDEARGWLLMEDLAGSSLLDCGLTWWHAALEAMAWVQIQALGELAAFRAAGCPDFGVEQMRRWTDEFLGLDGPVRAGHIPGLAAPDAAYLLDNAARISSAWDALGAAGIPDSFEHGDFRPGHVVISHGAMRFFDVADAAISHPFFSAVTMLDFERVPEWAGHSAADVRAELTQSYLRPWREAFPHVDVEAVYRAARPLAVMHAALVRWYHLLPAMVPRWDWEFMVAFWLRKLTDPPQRKFP
jgi:hypothetical protein